MGLVAKACRGTWGARQGAEGGAPNREGKPTLLSPVGTCSTTQQEWADARGGQSPTGRRQCCPEGNGFQGRRAGAGRGPG